MRVALVHDVTRASCQAGHHQVAAFWRDTLAPAFTALGHSLHCPGAFAADLPEPVADLMRRRGLAPGPATWTRLHSDLSLVPALAAMLGHVEADLVLGWELSPNMLRALDQRGLPVIDMSLAPLRFDTDLHLRMRSNQATWSERLAALAIPGAVFRNAAQRLREALGPQARGAPAHQGPPALLYVGQTDLDASLISGGAVASVADHLPALHALLADGAPLWLKPHPHGERHADIRLLHDRFPQAMVVTDAIYGLLCDPAVGTVATLSSSVADEAGWFGRRAVRLIVPDDSPGAVPGMSDFHIVRGPVTSPGFWNAVLAGGPLPGDAPHLSLRRLFRLTWGWPPLPPRPVPVLTPGLRLALRPTDAACRFGWGAADGEGVRSATPLATLAFRRGSAGTTTIAIACRVTASNPGQPVALNVQLRPSGAEVAATMAGNTVLQLPLPAPDPSNMDWVELSFRLPEDEREALRVIAVEVLN